MLKLLVLDCDGVMFSSKEANRRYYNDMLAAFGKAPMTEPELNYVHMSDVAGALRFLFGKYPEISWAEVEKLWHERGYEPYLRYMTMAPGLPEFLRDVRACACHTAISSNRDTTMTLILETFGLSGLFDLVATANTVPHPKPAADALFMILAHFNLPAESALYLGDSKVDEEHARGAGVAFAAFGNTALQADYHVASFAEVRRLRPVEEMFFQAGRS